MTKGLFSGREDANSRRIPRKSPTRSAAEVQQKMAGMYCGFTNMSHPSMLRAEKFSKS